MASAAYLQRLPAGKSELGSSFFRRTASNLVLNRVPFLEAGIGGNVTGNCVIELHGHAGTGKTFTLCEIAVEAIINNSGSADCSVNPRTVLWFDADFKFNPSCIIKCAKKIIAESKCTLNEEELLSRIIVFKPAGLLQLVATLQGIRLNAYHGSFPEIGSPVTVIVDGISPMYSSSRAAGETAPSMFDQVFEFPAFHCSRTGLLHLIHLQLVVELGAITGRGRGDMPKFQCSVFVSSVPVSPFSSSHSGDRVDQVLSQFLGIIIHALILLLSSLGATGAPSSRTNSLSVRLSQCNVHNLPTSRARARNHLILA
jgi:hypothetical protein